MRRRSLCWMSGETADSLKTETSEGFRPVLRRGERKAESDSPMHSSAGDASVVLRADMRRRTVIFDHTDFGDRIVASSSGNHLDVALRPNLYLCPLAHRCNWRML